MELILIIVVLLLLFGGGGDTLVVDEVTGNVFPRLGASQDA